MSRNWLRSCTLSLSGGASKTIKGGGPTDLRITFEIEQAHVQSPAMGHFRVYDPAPATIQSFLNKEFQKITFSAGYESNVGLIFQGDIAQSIYGHENPVDTYIDIFAHDGGNAYQQARVTKTLQAGYTPADKFKVATDAMAQFGVTVGTNTLDLSQPKYPRGAPFIGMARTLMREVVLSAGGIWSVQQGKIMATPKSLDSGNSDTIDLTAATGLVGYPQQTQDGVRVISLLNPSLRPLQKIKLDPSQIIAAAQNNNPLDTGAQDTNLNLTKQYIGAGTYTIYKITRTGDTRGQPWYDESICIGVGGSAGPGLIPYMGAQ